MGSVNSPNQSGGTFIGSSSTGRRHVVYTGSSDHFKGWDGSDYLQSTIPYPISSYFLLEQTFINSTLQSYFYQNGTPSGSGNANGTIDNQTIELGGCFGANYSLVGNIAEVLVYSSASNALTVQVEDYIKNRFRIQQAPTIATHIPVSDQAFKFSPGNWKGRFGTFR